MVTIRQLRQGDAAAVRELDRSIRGPERSVTWDQYVERTLDVIGLESLMFPPWGCFVAEEEGRVVGFLLSERQTPAYGLPPGARIVAMGVTREFRGRGIGHSLVDALTAACGAQGVEEMYAVLRGEDEGIAAFMESAGFSASELKVYSRHS